MVNICSTGAKLTNTDSAKYFRKHHRHYTFELDIVRKKLALFSHPLGREFGRSFGFWQFLILAMSGRERSHLSWILIDCLSTDGNSLTMGVMRSNCRASRGSKETGLVVSFRPSGGPFFSLILAWGYCKDTWMGARVAVGGRKASFRGV